MFIKSGDEIMISSILVTGKVELDDVHKEDCYDHLDENAKDELKELRDGFVELAKENNSKN